MVRTVREGAGALMLSQADRGELTSMARSRSLPAALALRARNVLACADGADGVSGIAQRLGLSRDTVRKWRDRWGAHGLQGLYDELRPGAAAHDR